MSRQLPPKPVNKGLPTYTEPSAVGQISGFLLKKSPIGFRKWNSRFCVVRDTYVQVYVYGRERHVRAVAWRWCGGVAAWWLAM